MLTHPNPKSVEIFKTMHTSNIKTSKTDNGEGENYRECGGSKTGKGILLLLIQNYFRDLNVYTEGFCQLALFSRSLHYAKYK